MSGLFATLFPSLSSAPAQQTAAPTQTANPQQTQSKSDPVPEKSPAELYAKLWDTPAAPDGTDGTLPENLYANVDAKKMREAVSGLDLTRGIPDEDFAKIAAGGEDAIAALKGILNHVSQNVLANSAFTATKIAERGFVNYSKGVNSRLIPEFRKLAASEATAANNPALNDPIIAPIVNALQTQLAAQFPGATSAELAAHTQQLLAYAGSKFAPPSQQSGNKQVTKTADGTDDVDWFNFAGVQGTVSS